MDNHPKQSISVVIPVYNSEGTLGLLAERLTKVLSQITPDYEIILVNDDSLDGSWEVIREISRQYSCVRGISLMRNFGQHNALLCGIRMASKRFIVTMDDDLQNPPEEIPRLLAKLSEGYDVVYGVREQERHSLWRNFASIVTKIVLAKAMGAEIARKLTAFRMFRTNLRDAFAHYESPLVSIDVLLTWGTTKFGRVVVQHDPRIIGRSNYTLRRLIRHSLNMITGFSILPLQVASVLGLIFTMFGVSVLIYVLGRYFLFEVRIQGFTFLASSIAIFSGVQLLSLGIIGEYMARMYSRMMDRPVYTIREVTGRD